MLIFHLISVWSHILLGVLQPPSIRFGYSGISFNLAVINQYGVIAVNHFLLSFQRKLRRLKRILCPIVGSEEANTHCIILVFSRWYPDRPVVVGDPQLSSAICCSHWFSESVILTCERRESFGTMRWVYWQVTGCCVCGSWWTTMLIVYLLSLKKVSRLEGCIVKSGEGL